LNNTLFQQAALSMSTEEPTMVLILNKHALNMTYNWLCNTQQMPDVHKKSLIVTLDPESDIALEKNWPQIRRLNWHVPCLEVSYTYLKKTRCVSINISRKHSIMETENINYFICSVQI
jgi:hypothetical protein